MPRSRRSQRRPHPRMRLDLGSDVYNTTADEKDELASRDGGARGGDELFTCPWPGCGKTFDRIKSRSAHLKWHGGSFERMPGENDTGTEEQDGVCLAWVALL